MQSRRVAEILEALKAGKPPAMSHEELTVLTGGNLVRSFDRPTRDRLASEAERLVELTGRVQELSRAVHGWSDGTGVFLGASGAYAGPGVREELRSAMNDLEELTRARAVVESLVWNDASESFCFLTLEGRRALADLRNWGARAGDLPHDEFRERLRNYRASLGNAIGRADTILRSLYGWNLLDAMPDFTRADLRLASIALTARPGDAFQAARDFASVFTSPAWQGTRREDHLVGAVVLAGLPGDAAAAMQVFQQTRYALAQRGILPDDTMVVAAALADLPDPDRANAMTRLVDLRTARPAVSPAILAGLARPAFPLEEALRRLEDTSAGLGRLGYADGEQAWAASAILAASPWPFDTALERFHEIAGRLPGAFYSPLVAGALLSTSLLEPTEAVESLEESIGAVTRANFFDLTVEIESLALILSHVVAPLDFHSALAGVPPPMLAPLPPQVVPVSTWFVPHNLWVYRPVVRYIASHPAHVHTIAGFG